MTPQELNSELDDAAIRARRILVTNLDDVEFRKHVCDGPAFHDLLVRAQENGWIHYTRLASALDLSSSQVNRWFKPSGEAFAPSRSTPNRFTILAALDALKAVLEVDIALLADGDVPIGGRKAERQKADA